MVSQYQLCVLRLEFICFFLIINLLDLLRAYGNIKLDIDKFVGFYKGLVLARRRFVTSRATLTSLRQKFVFGALDALFALNPSSAPLYQENMLIFNRPGVTGAILQTALSLINLLLVKLNHPFPPDLQNIITLKPFELGS